MEIVPKSEHRRDPQMPLRKIVEIAVGLGASDIHLKADRPPAFRVSGALRFSDLPTLGEDDILSFAQEILSPEEYDQFLKTGDMDHALTIDEFGRFRVNCYRQRGMPVIVLRWLKTKIPTFQALHLPEAPMLKIASLRRGLVLVTGTTSSGKTTTLAAIIERINETRESHIVTLEDPIEFVHEDKKCCVCQREVGIDTADFATGMRAIMREDPDVILIGEMRDRESFQTCMSAAETGHLVFSALHTTNVRMTVDRVMDMFPAEEDDQIRSQLSYQLKAVISQRLLPTLDGKGRVPAVEIMFNNPGIAALIRDNELDQIPLAIADGEEEGMQSFNVSLAHLVKEKKVSEEAALRASDNPEELKMNLQGIFISREHGGILKKPHRT